MAELLFARTAQAGDEVKEIRTAMAIAGLIRAVETLAGLADVARRVRDGRRREETPSALEPTLPSGGVLGQLETRLTGVMVAALKEAFDRDRVRLDLEREQIEAERRRAEEARRSELLRQEGEHALGQVRLVAVMSLVIWATSALVAAWLPGMQADNARVLLALAWLALLATLAVGFIAHAHILRSLAQLRLGSGSLTDRRDWSQTALPWLLVLGLGLTASSLIASI